MADKTQIVVRKTINQLRVDYPSDAQMLDRFEKRLDDNLELAEIPRITGRKPRKPVPEQTTTRDA